jgi:assimilatory nitrate reductase catalytic subunit
MIAAGLPFEQIRLWALAPVNTPPVGGTTRGKIVCNCKNVSEQEILAALKRGADLTYLQTELKCGTECGSCLPELRRMVGEAALPGECRRPISEHKQGAPIDLCA